METWRWAVMGISGRESNAQALASALSGLPGIEATVCHQVPQRPAGIVGALFVVDGDHAHAALEQMAQLRQAQPECAMLCAVERVAVAALIDLLGAGWHDFVILPCAVAELELRVRRAVGEMRLAGSQAVPAADTIRGFVYKSKACAQVAAKLRLIAGCRANVLIDGETGTGKEVCAQAVHYLSARASQPWVTVNCGALPLELVENELFGHAKGAYTTAHTASPGLVQHAEGGTLFLDEVDSLPLAAQAKLLRFLQEHEYRPIGASTVVHADVRVIAASNRDLHALVQSGNFRQDLYYRLNVLNLHLPALRDRREDIPVLALHFLRQFAREFERGVSAIAPGALHRLLLHDWPGNVRELRHVMERAVLLAAGPTLGADDVDIGRAAAAPAGDDDDSFRTAKMRVVDSFERGYVEQLLSAHGGNVTHAAQAAKKDRRAFFELIRKHGIEPQRFRLPAA